MDAGGGQGILHQQLAGHLFTAYGPDHMFRGGGPGGGFGKHGPVCENLHGNDPHILGGSYRDHVMLHVQVELVICIDGHQHPVEQIIGVPLYHLDHIGGRVMS